MQITAIPVASPSFDRTAAPDATGAVDDVEFRVVDSAEGLAALKTDWNDLFERAGRPTQVFQTHGFATVWAATYLTPSARLAVLTARRHGRLVMVWPMVVERSMGLTTVSWLGAPIAQYGDILAESNAHPLPLLRAAWSELRRSLKPDGVRLRKVRADALVAPLLAELGGIATNGEEAACVTLRSSPWALSSFDDRQSGKAKKNRRRLLRRLEEQGSVQFNTPVSPGQAVNAAAVGLTQKRQWLDARGLLSVAFSDRRIEDFFAAAAGPGAADTGCTIFTLDVDGAPAAVAIGFLAKHRLTLHMITYDLEREKSGVGVLNLEAILRWAEEHDCEAVDLLAPKAEYKMDWADVTIPVADHAIPLTLAGQGCVRVYDSVIRPQAKAALASLPAAARRYLGSHVSA